MKITLALLAASIAFTTWSQTPAPTQPAPTSPGRPNTSPGQPNAAPGQPRMSPPFQQAPNTVFTPPTARGVTTNALQVAGFTNSLGNPFALTNQFFLTNSFSGGISQIGLLLQDLQLTIDQALPLLIALSAGANVTDVTAPTGAATTRTVNGGVNLGRDLSVNAGVNAAVPTVPATTPGLPATGRTDPLNAAFTSRLGTNVFGTNPETYQLLLLLQNDLTRARETLARLNSTDTGVAFTNRFFLLTNSFRTR